MDPLATVQQVTDRLPEDTPVPDETKVTSLLEDASGLVRTAVDDQEKWPAAGDAPASVVAIVCRAVVRAIDNPRGVAQETHGNWTQAFGSRNSAGHESGSGVFLTDSEIRDVRRAAGMTGWSSIEVEHHYGHHSSGVDSMIGF